MKFQQREFRKALKNIRKFLLVKLLNVFFQSTPFLGATNVGSVDVYIDKDLKTNKWVGFRRKINDANQYDEVRLPEINLKKGELLGQFNMGSTVVLIFEAPKNFR